MESGFVIDKVGNDSSRPPERAEGVPERSFRTGLNLAHRERHAIVTFRCSTCGYLEAYAPSV